MAANLTWTWEQHKKFANAVAIYGFDETPGMWRYLIWVTGKTEEEVKLHYEKLMRGIRNIEAGLLRLPENENVIDGLNNNGNNRQDYD
ncbi:hypothetical protein P3S67_017806 [Capsicum chacoense]